MNIQKLIQTDEQILLEILRVEPDAVRYPQYINQLYLQKKGFGTSLTPLELAAYKFAPSNENMPRILRKLVSQGLITLPEDIAKKRQKLKDESIVVHRKTKALKTILEPQEIKKIPKKYEPFEYQGYTIMREVRA